MLFRSPELRTTLDKVVASQKVLLFMKGTAEFPQCGFSSTVVQMLKSLNVPFETIDVLENEILRQGLKEYSNWPTFPQLYIDGEFFGGCDITVGKHKIFPFRNMFVYCYSKIVSVESPASVNEDSDQYGTGIIQRTLFPLLQMANHDRNCIINFTY